MGYSRFTGNRNIPNVGTAKSSPVTTNFAKGVYTYKPNDTMGYDEVRLAQDARFDRVGEYGTRLGYKQLTTPIGYATYYGSVPAGSWAVTTASLQPMTFTAASDATICSIKFKACLKSGVTRSSIPTGRVNIMVGGNIVAQSCFKQNQVIPTELEVFFNQAPEIKEDDTVTITVDMQTPGDDLYYISASNPGNVMQAELFSCTAGAVTNVFETNIDGDKSIFFVFNGTLYWRNSSGTVSSIRTLPAGVKKVRFSQNLNQIRYVDGLEAPHLLSPTVTSGVVTAWADSAIPVTDLQTGTALNVTMSNIKIGRAHV